MCGRYTLDIDGETLWEQLNLIGDPLPWHPRFNIAPAQEAPVVGRMRRRNGERVLGEHMHQIELPLERRWGPSRAADGDRATPQLATEHS